MDVTKDTVMPGAWAVVGLDRFAEEYYPKAIVQFRQEAHEMAESLNGQQPGKQPGGLHDVFAPMRLNEAARRCDMTVEQFVRFVAEMGETA